MVRIIVPVVLILLIVVGVFAFLKTGKDSMGPSLQNQPNVSVTEQKIPVTGNPDDVAATIIKAASDEQVAVGAEEKDVESVTSDNAEINAIGESVNENEF